MRKKDKRSIATEAAIKEALLEQLRARRFREITVSEVCRAASTTRATFYQHYGNLADVLDELLDDVVCEAGDVPLDMCEACANDARPPDQAFRWEGIPFCHFYASDNRYRALLEENEIAERLIARMVDRGLDAMVARIRARYPRTNVDRAQVRYFNIFRMSGCLAAAKAARRNGYDWSLIQPTLDAALSATFTTLR